MELVFPLLQLCRAAHWLNKDVQAVAMRQAEIIHYLNIQFNNSHFLLLFFYFHCISFPELRQPSRAVLSTVCVNKDIQNEVCVLAAIQRILNQRTWNWIHSSLHGKKQKILNYFLYYIKLIIERLHIRYRLKRLLMCSIRAFSLCWNRHKSISAAYYSLFFSTACFYLKYYSYLITIYALQTFNLVSNVSKAHTCTHIFPFIFVLGF